MCTLLTFSLPALESAQILYMQLTLPPIYYIWTLRLLQLLLTWKKKLLYLDFAIIVIVACLKKYYIWILQLLWILPEEKILYLDFAIFVIITCLKKYYIWTLQLLTPLKQENRARIAIWADGGSWSNVINRVWT